ncbi:MAG TPA: hypothetical protein VEV17_08980 [Bryobacteraceae bacterium]|nr:hypothetical protein [Bryobacteraceae bacterium]
MKITLGSLSLLLAAFLLQAQPGPPIGAKVPDFALVDQNGQTRNLMSLMGTKGLMLVFFRSADW